MVQTRGLARYVHLVGQRSDVPCLMTAADLFVLPSQFEGLPLVVLEAMASGLPVVGTRVGGLQTLIDDGESGLLVPAGDYQALADAIARVLTDPRLRMHLAHGARERAEHYTWQSVGARMEALYARILADERSRVEV